MGYNQETKLNTNDIVTLRNIFDGLIQSIKHISVDKALRYVKSMPLICKMHYDSLENKKRRSLNARRLHPVVPQQGEIYNAYITEGVGSELCNNHLVVIMSNTKNNMYSEKVNIVPIEGDGTKINNNYQMKLTNKNLEIGHIDKEPSRIIITDIMTIDKARLGRKIGYINDDYVDRIGEMISRQLSR